MVTLRGILTILKEKWMLHIEPIDVTSLGFLQKLEARFKVQLGSLQQLVPWLDLWSEFTDMDLQIAKQGRGKFLTEFLQPKLSACCSFLLASPVSTYWEILWPVLSGGNQEWSLWDFPPISPSEGVGRQHLLLLESPLLGVSTNPQQTGKKFWPTPDLQKQKSERQIRREWMWCWRHIGHSQEWERVGLEWLEFPVNKTGPSSLGG